MPLKSSSIKRTKIAYVGDDANCLPSLPGITRHRQIAPRGNSPDALKSKFVETWPIDRLKPAPGNPRTHDEEQIAQIAASIERFGFTNPVLIGRDGEIIAGHGRVAAARRLRWRTVPVLRLDQLTEAERRLTSGKSSTSRFWHPT